MDPRIPGREPPAHFAGGGDEGRAHDDRLRSWITIAMVVIGALTLLGLVALWPRGDAPDLGIPPRTSANATVTDIEEGTCPGIEVNVPTPCRLYDVQVTSGDDKGDDAQFAVDPTQFEIPELDVGDHIVLLKSPNPDAQDPYRYAFSDYQRSSPMIWLLVAFVIVVIAFGRFQGVRALAGLAVSLAVLVTFVVPALLRDSPAILVALVGTVAVAFVALYLAHGFGLLSTLALAGTLVSLAVTTVLAVIAASLTQLSGLGSEEAQALRVTAQALDLRGLLVAGIVVGALGVLDDVTVTQVSVVAALRRANPTLGARQLYAEATSIGRDHVASTVNTLVLAYAGASLPLLLFFAEGNQPFGRLVTGELVAVEIVRMLVGSIGLVLSVPVTTWLAAAVLSNMDDVSGLEDSHGHDHGHGHGHGRAAPVPPEPPAPGPYAPGPQTLDRQAPRRQAPGPFDPRGQEPDDPDRPVEPWF
jgi:uncharacterized membrane protein